MSAKPLPDPASKTAGKSAAGYNIDPNRYELDVNDVIVFPDAAHSPVFPPNPGESWYVLTEIKSSINDDLPTFCVEDRLAGTYWTVVFCTTNTWEDTTECKPGRVLCIKNGRVTQLFEEHGPWGKFKFGYRILNKDDFVVLPCSLNKLRLINQYLLDRYASGQFLSCVVCNKPEKMRCPKCTTRYCSMSCQQAEWPSHRPVCKVFKTLYEWNVTDWG